MPLSQTIKGL